ncbi:glycosyltransferase family 39 protein [Pleomorphomonas koreensis]|uniref:glycosyltransferase family 39 protein n=1 Tax=Pleomorphomonas koreensis TaxID=257440 RepID=UPI0012EB2A52|nr:glycosyltransferase family 39 protein [Pleomorphomonas koreensis]
MSARPPSMSDRLLAGLDRLATPTGAAFLLVFHVVVTGLLRYVFVTGLELDDGEAAALMQHALAPAYQVRNPPLYEWLLWGTEQLVGVGFAAHILLRHLLILAVGLIALAVGRRLLGPRWAGLMVFSLFLTVWFPLNFLFWGTHTLLLAVSVFGWCAALVDWRATRGNRALVALAGFAALGLLSKWSFPLILVGSAAALAFDRTGRRALADWRLLAIPLAMAVTSGPVFYAIAGHGGDVVAMSAANLAGVPKAWAARAFEALWRMPVSFSLFLLPWGLIVALVWRLAPARGGEAEESLLLVRIGLLLAAVSWVGAVLTGSANINEHYMYAIALPVLIGGVGVVLNRADPLVLGRVLAAGAALVVVIILVVRVVACTAGGFPERKENKRLFPYPALAATLVEKGYGEAAFIADNNTLAGNLLTVLPASRVQSPGSLGFLRLPIDLTTRRCVAIWSLGFRPVGSPPPPTPDGPADRLAGHVDASARVEVVSALWAPTWLGSRRISDWAIAEQDASACAALFLPPERP